MQNARDEHEPHRARRLRRRIGGALAALTVLAATGCTGGSNADVIAHSSIADVPVGQGGSLVIGAEQEPDCTDWIAVCAGSLWGQYIMEEETVPQVFTVVQQGKNWVPVASNLMAATPTSVIADGRQTITYKLNPAAVWSDGAPITSADLKYTALQIRDGSGIFDQTGYNLISSIATPDARTAVVTLKTSYANWRELFGASYGVLPSHLLQGKNRAALMSNGYSWSGGPWKISSWNKGTSVTLVPNDRYWGAKPKLDKVTFVFTTDTASEFQAFASGQLDAIYPTPQLDVLSQIQALGSSANLQVEAQSGNLQALWMNNGTFPFNSQAVRQAFAYSVDRSAIAKRLFGPLGTTSAAQSFNSPLVSQYAAKDFAQYTPNLAKVTQIMTAAGWAKNSSGIWAKDGRAASFTIVSLAGNESRELIEQILQQQLQQAGFQMTIQNTTTANLFGKLAPNGNFQLGLWTLTDSFPDPTLDVSFSSPAIPSAANGYSGINFMRVNVPGLDALLTQVNTETDQSARIQASLKAEKLIAESVPSLPLGAVPNILLTNKVVGGPVSINPVEGPFWNLAAWGLAK